MSELGKKNKFVMFFAPWCTHCKRLYPTWENLGKEFDDNDNLEIGKVDCTKETELCSNQDITGYPTLKIFKKGETEGKKFKGSRDIPTLKNFIQTELEDFAEEASEGKEAEVEALINLTDDTFDEHVAQGSHFVKFFAPWCSHCQTLAPTWHELAESLKDNKDVSVAKIDCTQSQRVCTEFNVISYPTLLWIQDGKKVSAYQGGRSLELLGEFVSQMLTPEEGYDSEDSAPEDNMADGKPVIALTMDNFHPLIENGFTFVKFFAPWCGHCKRLAPTWEELAQQLNTEGEVKIAHVDCTQDDNKELCTDQEVEGYPTLFLYRNGLKISEYNGSRVLEDLLEFIKRHISHDEL